MPFIILIVKHDVAFSRGPALTLACQVIKRRSRLNAKQICSAAQAGACAAFRVQRFAAL
jgi:hypothetical protein